jgi:transcriptional regulator with PAS, ATPase and Fis domain
VADHTGVFQRAHGGTLFLDEVAEIPLELQARLLRVLEDRSFVPVGGTKPMRADVRIVSATHRALRREVAEGRFRDDLRYRLRVVPVFLPPLRERTGDVEALLFHFVAHFNAQGWRRVEAVSAPALDALRAYPWPGNVRELRNVIEHAFVVGEGPVLRVDDFPPELRGEPPPEAAAGGGETLRSAERARLLAALAAERGRRDAAARALGVSRSTLWRKLREHRLA